MNMTGLFNKTYDKAPGNILQEMYLKHRLKTILQNYQDSEASFIEIGSGSGNMSRILLDMGLHGIGFELNEEACRINSIKNEKFIKSNTYKIINENYFAYVGKEFADVIISSHVLEHMLDDDLKKFFNKSYYLLKDKGRIISLVPACMRCWGIEDETAGHYRRFEFQDFINISEEYNLKIINLVGLTYPLSNLVLKLSNYLIKKNESWKKDLSKDEQTKLSSSGGAKQVMYKTNFPYWFKYIVNDVTMYPFYILQRVFQKNKSSMVIYCELQK